MDDLNKIKDIVKGAMAPRKLDSVTEEYGYKGQHSRIFYFCDFETLDAIAEEINDGLLNAGLAPEWVAECGPRVRARPDMGYMIEVISCKNDGCPRCIASQTFFKIKVMKKTRATKKLTQSGDSLVINVTKEVKPLGLQRGDYVNVTIEPADDHD